MQVYLPLEGRLSPPEELLDEPESLLLDGADQEDPLLSDLLDLVLKSEPELRSMRLFMDLESLVRAGRLSFVLAGRESRAGICGAVLSGAVRSVLAGAVLCGLSSTRSLVLAGICLVFVLLSISLA